MTVNDTKSFLLPPQAQSSAPKSKGVKTGNLVQHNRKASFSASQGFEPKSSRVTFSSPSLRNRSISEGGPRLPSSLPSTSSQDDFPAPVMGNVTPDQIPKERPKTKATNPSPTFSFASIASKGYSKQSSFNKDKLAGASSSSVGIGSTKESKKQVKIPSDLWTSRNDRSSSSFRIADPISRYKEISKAVARNDTIDLHSQSMKTFPIVLSTILPEKLRDHKEVWIVAGNGHHINESAVTGWLVSNDYKFSKGKDKNGFALLVYHGR